MGQETFEEILDGCGTIRETDDMVGILRSSMSEFLFRKYRICVKYVQIRTISSVQVCI